MTQPEKSPKEFIDSVFDASDFEPSENFKAAVCSIIENFVVSLADAVDGELDDFYDRRYLEAGQAEQADMDR